MPSERDIYMLDKEKINVYSNCRGEHMKLFTALSRSSNSRGFTLVEMLIVVALIAALAVGLLATLDPLEKLRLGRDSASFDVASSIQDSLVDYYTISSAYPFAQNVSGISLTAGNATITSGLGNMTASGSLKNTFFSINSSVRGDVLVTTNTSLETVITCFLPDSKKYKSDSIFDNAGVSSATCPGAATCYYCLK